MIKNLCVGLMILMLGCMNAVSQDSTRTIQVGESMKEYIRENHIDKIEDMVHQFASGKVFLDFLLTQGHNVDVTSADIKRRDIRVGKDVDVYVKHYSEHQNFTMILVPIDIYSLLIYDTLLFSVMEVSDAWLSQKYRYHDISDPEVKEKLLTLENHEALAKHMYEQARDDRAIGHGEVQIQLHEGYISSSSVNVHVSELSRNEKKEFRNSWTLMKKAFSHDINLNVEMNIYIFGADDMKILLQSKGTKSEYKITPRNIFTRHIFLED